MHSLLIKTLNIENIEMIRNSWHPHAAINSDSSFGRIPLYGDPDDVVEQINGKALAMGLGEVSVHYRGSTGGMEDLFDISQGKRFTLLRLLPQDPTSENREGALDQQIEKVLLSLSQQPTDLSLLETPRDLPEE